MSNSHWFVFGQMSFGLVIGVVAGLSSSPIVGTLFGLLFAFIGGSIIVLIKGRTEEELALVGKSIGAMSLCIVVGVIVGIYLRANDVLYLNQKTEELFKTESSSQPYFNLSKPLEFEEIVELAKKGISKEALCLIIRTHKSETPIVLDKSTFIAHSSKEVSELVVYSLFSRTPVKCSKLDFEVSNELDKKIRTILYGNLEKEKKIEQDLRRVIRDSLN